MLEDRKTKQAARKTWTAEMNKHYADTDCARGCHRTKIVTQEGNTCANCGTLLCHHHRSSLMGCMLKRGHSGKHANPSNTRLLFADDGAASLDNWTDDEGRYINTQEDWHALIDDIGKRHQQ